jgi:predicted PurR-regulated permease PerM
MSLPPRISRAYFQKLLLIILTLFLLVYLISSLKELCLLILIGFCIAYLIEPTIQFFEKYKVRRPIRTFNYHFSTSLYWYLVYLFQLFQP